MMDSYSILFGLLPGLVLFLYGIEHFSQEMMSLSGERFHKILERLSSNRIYGSILGALFTGVIQSSSATTVIAISLVNAGILRYTNSLGIILGSNIGTTITAQLVAFKFSYIAPVIITLGFFLSIFSKKYGIIGKAIFYFGLVFFGISIISDAIIPLKNDPYIISTLSNFSNIYIGVIAGVIFTTIVQSSSVTTGITVVMAQSGLITLNEAVPLIIGANIGTATTAIIASYGMNLYARRSSMAHIMSKIISTIVIWPFVHIFISFIQKLGGTPAHQVANAHTFFNLGLLILFLIFLDPFKKLINFIVPGDEDELILETKHIKDDMDFNNTQTSLSLIDQEIEYALFITSELILTSITTLKSPTRQYIEQSAKLERLNDFLDEKIEQALLELSKQHLSEQEAKEIILLIRISNSIEQLGDLASDISELAGKLNQRGTVFTQYTFNNLEKITEPIILSATQLVNLYSSKKSKIKLITNKHLEKIITDLLSDYIDQLKAEDNYLGGAFVEVSSILQAMESKIYEVRDLIKDYKLLK